MRQKKSVLFQPNSYWKSNIIEIITGFSEINKAREDANKSIQTLTSKLHSLKMNSLYRLILQYTISRYKLFIFYERKCAVANNGPSNKGYVEVENVFISYFRQIQLK